MLEGLARFGVRVSDKKLFTTLLVLVNTLATLLTQRNFRGKTAHTIDNLWICKQRKNKRKNKRKKKKE